MSPASRCAASSSIALPVTPAGTISQTARGRGSFATRSTIDATACTRALATFFAAAGFASYATHSCPSFARRRTRLAPIRPRPIMPRCISNLLRSRGRAMATPDKQRCRWRTLPDRRALDREAAAAIRAAAARAIAERGAFHLVLAGGETPLGAYRRLRDATADWAAWHVYFGDERCLPPDDPG